MNVKTSSVLSVKVKKVIIIGALLCLAVIALRPFLLQCALLSAIEGANIVAAQRLLKAGADANTTDFDGRPVIILAVNCYQREDIVALLLNYGANVDASDKYQQTALTHAASQRAFTISQLLVSRGADVNVKDFHGTTPLMYAAIEADEPTIRLLLSHGADATVKDGYFETALDYVYHCPANHDLVVLLQGAMQTSSIARRSPSHFITS